MLRVLGMSKRHIEIDVRCEILINLIRPSVHREELTVNHMKTRINLKLAGSSCQQRLTCRVLQNDRSMCNTSESRMTLSEIADRKHDTITDVKRTKLLFDHH